MRKSGRKEASMWWWRRQRSLGVDLESWRELRLRFSGVAAGRGFAESVGGRGRRQLV